MLIGEKWNYADVSKYTNKCIYTDLLLSDDSYLPLLKKIIYEDKIDIIIPAGDESAEYLSLHKSELLPLVHFKVPDYKSFMNGYDKNRLMILCKEKNYPHPYTIDLSTIDYNNPVYFDKFPYPGILKPNCTTGGRGMCVINNYDDLLRIYPSIKNEYGECHLQQYLNAGGRQVKVQIYINEKGEMLNHSVLDKKRWYPVKGGSSCCAVSVEDVNLVNICHNVLKDINWIGFADFDCIENPDSGELLIMEINPRLPACVGAAVNAGINWGQIMVDDYMNQPQKSYTYKTGVSLRHLGLDFLWFIKSPNRFKTHPAWFDFWGKDVYYQDFDFFDQKPFWMGTYHNFKKLFDSSFKKAKSGVGK